MTELNAIMGRFGSQRTTTLYTSLIMFCCLDTVFGDISTPFPPLYHLGSLSTCLSAGRVELRVGRGLCSPPKSPLLICYIGLYSLK